MKLSLVKKNILKTKGYQCYCTGMKQKWSCNWSIGGKADTKYLMVFHLENSKYLKCFCIIPSAFHLKESSIKVRQIGFIYSENVYMCTYIHLLRGGRTIRMEEVFECARAQVEDTPLETGWLSISSEKQTVKRLGKYHLSCRYKSGWIKKK